MKQKVIQVLSVLLILILMQPLAYGMEAPAPGAVQGQPRHGSRKGGDHYRGWSDSSRWRDNHKGFDGVNTWARDEFSAAVASGLVPQGFEQLSMSEAVTRQEFCSIVTLLFDAFAPGEESAPTVSPFVDCNDPTVAAAYAKGLVSGYDENRFRPEESVSRQEMLKMLYNVLTALGQEPAVSDESAAAALQDFEDSGDVQGWAVKPVCAMLYADVTTGVDGRLAPLETTTREQAAVTAYRFSRALIRGDFEGLDGSARNRQGDRQRSGGVYEEKYIKIFGSLDTPVYKTQEEAAGHMTTITVPVWTVNAAGSKVSSSRSLTVHANIAETVALIFQEIYDGPEQFPIYSVGGYSWRASETSEHRWGLAIDINPNENYMIKPDGTIVAGSFWSPDTSIYSIPLEGDVVRAFEAHGFVWGGTAWKSSNDYMHFSYLGR